jgi:hypothetical protein
MRGTSEFFETQIGMCARQAAEATLSNQRDMFLRAGAAWQLLADKERKTEIERSKRNATSATA